MIRCPACGATFAEPVEHSPVPVVVDMWAEWCGPQTEITRRVEQLRA